ncbi:MAG: zf-HC2 domain-containing protein [Chloroflexi bacterium]|nr:zf-HC2 domain-containing protein [Chloroflexota bacterium]
MSSDYIDGELSEARAATVSSHILNCGPCRSFINTLRATVKLLRSTPKEVPPSDYKQRLQERLNEERSK